VALAPHYSSISIGGYAKAVQDACAGASRKIRAKVVKSWHTNPLLISLWAKRVSSLSSRAGADAEVIFSAHSLPERIIREGDPYRDQLMETSRMIAQEAGRKEWSFAFQSASKTGEPWLGPDIVSHLQGRFDAGAKSFIIAPIGFVSDHLEILYDIDVECQNWAREAGAGLFRCESPNDSPDFIACLRSVASEDGFA
jgi:protoporphyrin/coproporphyrin ferrochelatase